MFDNGADAGAGAGAVDRQQEEQAALTAEQAQRQQEQQQQQQAEELVRKKKRHGPIHLPFQQKKKNLPPRILIYDATASAAVPGGSSSSSTSLGVGHLMQGLLAAHLLGMEFNRTVCVEWPEFLSAFEVIDSKAIKHCHGKTTESPTASISLWKSSTTTGSDGKNSYDDGYILDECSIKLTLESNAHATVSMSGNTYPRWHADIPHNFLETFYRFKQISKLPDPFPVNVIHLRAPQATEEDVHHQDALLLEEHFDKDKYRGLDDKSLYYLGQKFEGSSTLLVTNRPDLYQAKFSDCCGWSHLQRDGNGNNKNDYWSDLWLDWYIVYKTKRVYHTNSEFAKSATHWNHDSNAYQINGMTTIPTRDQVRDALDFIRDSYRVNNDKHVMIPLLARRKANNRGKLGYTFDAFMYFQNCKMEEKEKGAGARGYLPFSNNKRVRGGGG